MNMASKVTIRMETIKPKGDGHAFNPVTCTFPWNIVAILNPLPAIAQRVVVGVKYRYIYSIIQIHIRGLLGPSD